METLEYAVTFAKPGGPGVKSRVVKEATGEVVDAETLGGGDTHTRLSGVADYLAENDDHALALAHHAANLGVPVTCVMHVVMHNHVTGLDNIVCKHSFLIFVFVGSVFTSTSCTSLAR